MLPMLQQFVSDNLQLIYTQVIVDVITWIGLIYCIWTEPTIGNFFLLLATAILVPIFLVVSDTTSSILTCRWTITFPIIPLLIIQLLLRQRQWYGRTNTTTTVTSTTSTLWNRFVFVISIGMVLISIAASILFPPVQLPVTKSFGNETSYDVGVASFYLPIILKNKNRDNSETCDIKNTLFDHSHVPVKLLYPTTMTKQSSRTSMPYLSSINPTKFLKESMKAAAPKELKQYDWLMHHWLLVRIPLIPNATLKNSYDDTTKTNDKEQEQQQQKQRLPLIIFSHGLMGNSDLYTYQTMSLASSGFLVLLVNHLDGSAPVAQHYNGTHRTFDYSIVQLWLDGKHIEYTSTYVKNRKKYRNGKKVE
jgi:Platelet-activating factor acetylhydrolase, isoform II